MINADIWQRPVGQGGLCEGAVTVGAQVVRWVYDCGSNQTDRLEQELQNIGDDLDILFLSHLDKDHVNGLDQLLMLRSVDEVVLPYLEDYERVLVLARAAAKGRLAGQFLTFMAGPAGWLRGRGVNRVTFVRPPRDGDDDEGPRPELPLDAAPKIEGRVKPEWTPTPTHRRNNPSIAWAEPASMVSLTDGIGRAADWVYIPFAHKPPETLLTAFKKELALQFPGLRPTQIVQVVWKPEGREKLRACYNKIWSSDHNLVSLSLYTGPATNHSRWRQTLTCGSHHYCSYQVSGGEPVGWLTTGDADLSGPRRRAAFERFYAGVLARTSVLVVPHHGAFGSWDPAVLNGMTGLKIGCAAAGPNGYGHPHSGVISDIQAHPGAHFWQVSDNKATTLHLRAEL